MKLKKIITKISLLITFIILITLSLYIYMLYNKPAIQNIKIDEQINNYNTISLDVTIKNVEKRSIFCILITSDNNKTKQKIINNKCSFNVTNGKYNLIIQENNNIIDEETINVEVNKILEITASQETIYLPVNGKDTIKISTKTMGNPKINFDYKIEDENIATFKNNEIIGLSLGNTILNISAEEIETKINIVVTDLINNPHINNQKTPLSCNEFSLDQEQLLNTILENRVNNAGYATRAGVVAAGRFIALEFSRRILYFPENGRLNYVDGEGRYYHKGLYLTNNNFNKITKSITGPAPWGCSIYTTLFNRYMPNGLDCSGFVTWVLLNGGFDVGDIGAGPTGVKDITDLGQKTSLNQTTIDKIKVGDLLNSNLGDGHAAVIIGYDNTNYYVAESLWQSRAIYGVFVVSYSKQELINNFNYVMLMDSYYKENGNLTQMW